MTFLIPLTDLILDPRRPVDATTLPPDEVIRLVKLSMGPPLSDLVTVTIDNGIVSITLPDPQPSAEQRAKEFVNRGIDYGTQGSYVKAIDCFRKAVILNPTNTIALRNLAMSLLETGKTQEAEDNLIQVLALNPKDSDAFILLGNIFSQKKKDDASAERMFERAVALKPDAVALTNLATLVGKRGDNDKAEQLFNRAIEIDPEYPNSHYGLALLYNQRTERALLALNELFTIAKPDPVRSAPLYEQARSLFAELNRKNAEKNIDMVNAFVNERKRDIEKIGGIGIDIEPDDSRVNEQVVTLVAWRRGLSRHLIRYASNTPQIILPHLLAQQLEKLWMEMQARNVNRNFTFRSTKTATDKAQQSAGEFLEYLRERGISSADSQTLMKSLTNGLCSQLLNCPLDMVVETRLYQQYDVLRSTQFLSLLKQNTENLLALTSKDVAKSAPLRIYRAGLTMNCAVSIWTDSLYEGKTNYSEPYRKSDVWDTAVNLHDAFKSAMVKFEAGDEYDLIREFARILHLEDWYEMIPANSVVEEDGGVTNQELLDLKLPAATMYMIGILGRLSRMTKEQIKELGFEIALLGQHGIDYTTADSRYNLRSLPGEQFTGLQIVCMMYACFQVINPELNTGVDFSKEYATAKQIVENDDK